MRKPKIAISVDKPLLDLIDSKVDGNIIRSRSQAIEFYLRKGIVDQSINTAVILLKGDHQKISLNEIRGEKLIKKQLKFFQNNNVNNILIVTQRSTLMKEFLSEVADVNINIKVFEKEVKGNAQALISIKDKIQGNFIVMSGDTYNNFNLLKMSSKHMEIDKMATMGLMTRSDTFGYGTAILDGDFIVDFKEKPKESSTHIVNAGIYIFRQEVFEMFEGVNSLEKDLFPKLAKIKQLVGFFTYGEYLHIEK